MSDKAYKGDDLDIYIPQVKDATGALVDLTGATLYCNVRIGTGSTVAANSTTVDALAGTARARFVSATTAAWTDGESGTYDARIVTAAGLRLTVGSGSFLVVAAVTPTPA
jgi:hypothetical protein